MGPQISIKSIPPHTPTGKRWSYLPSWVMYYVDDKFFFPWDLSLCCKLKVGKSSAKTSRNLSQTLNRVPMRTQCPLLLTLLFLNSPRCHILDKLLVRNNVPCIKHTFFSFYKQALLSVIDGELSWLPDLSFSYCISWIYAFGGNTDR